MRDAVRAGVRTIEHIQDLSAEDADFLAASDAFLVPTLTATYNTVAVGAHASGLTDTQYGFFEENWQAKRRGMAQALRAGVKIALGTDAGYANCRHGESAKELLLLVETGMSPLQALTAATGTAAAAIGQAHLLGTLAPGKLADFVVVDGDPLADIGILTHPDNIVRVYKGGVLQ
jgi:imidazolonepropionase-like amidohydrolase